jgi:glycosyltransferase involved in cell wall biosynthesis
MMPWNRVDERPMSTRLLPMSMIIPTRNRATTLRRTLESLGTQSYQPAELIIVDASEDSSTRVVCEETDPGLHSVVWWYRADVPGAAMQRNQGVRASSHLVVGFMDDDILVEPLCFTRLWSALQSDPHLGGVNAMITNQHYQTPGTISRFVFRLMAGNAERSYAGRVLGPAVNLLPEDGDDLPEVVPVEWLNLGCTLYRREALPDPPFPSHFIGYSLMEDLALSLIVGRCWKLANVRTARIYHDSQPGAHKSDPAQLAEMQLVNRHFVMTRILGRDRLSDYLKLVLFELFSVASSLQSRSGRATVALGLWGRVEALRRMVNC